MSPNRQTEGRTDTQTDYSNPRCACTPRVNEWVKGLHTNFPVEERSPGVCMHVYYTRIICLLVEDVDIVISSSSSNL